ncbi:MULTISPECIES: 5'-deoxynucleotidase [unclassified Paenibacillus]|uniref:5'-deoxynucleotidase n=1 Tax=unclassified Paenibacillus TaxID=185978 RepID=UPI001C104BE0|nr:MULTISPECIES: 5'-deoxynucleotidase [unclassified Paenibacillus]MBU5441592.1 5'-deoxynucleotidase [Paenibacillus sp. MSJ-34]CAH0117738.1 5'-deoxynucleotidase YfbR [Paenibacillus sp. CECT 9249]
MENHFSAYMYRLRYIERWSLMRNMVKENVAEHSFHVSLLTHLLCTIGNEIYGRGIDTNRAVTMALFHDATEVFTGDIPTPVKHHNPQILKNFREIENIAAERLIGMVPEPLQNVYAPLLDPKRSNTPDLLAYVKAADLLDAYLKCATELAAGNREFAEAKRQAEDKLQQLRMPEMEYFLAYLAPSFEKTLDELSS